ncbi:MAG TPA: arsenate reductase (glutaredoxin) [Rhizobiales bacterium]|nr:arsenate reductase (glutaredoxin) [Hyphomicrobiales bacterium]
MIKILHNPRCSKSRATLGILKDKGVEPEIVEYLKDAPSSSELRDILRMLGKRPRDIIRRGEKVFRELGLDDPDLSDDELIEAMVDNPILIERPIVINGNKAALGRPPESVLDIL